MTTETFIFELRTRGAKRSARDIRRIGQSADQVRKTLAFLRSALVVVASVRIFAKLVGGLADFAQAMSTIKAVTGATTDQFRQMRDVAKELGATTRFTATEAAEGMLALGRAGFSTNEIIETIPQTLALAQAGALELGKASEITAGALRAFGLATEESERVVDVFTFTANNSLNTVLDLGEAMKLVAPIAAGVGVEIEELAAALGTLGNVNIRASLAGTGLRRVITDLESPTGDLAKILAALGIEQDEVRISTVGFAEALKVLADAGVGATLAARAFGKRGAAIFATLGANLNSTEAFAKALEKVQGITKKTADIMDDNLNGALLRTKSALEAVLLALGDLGLESFLTEFFNSLAEAFRAVARNIDNVVSAVGVLIKAFLLLKGLRLLLFLLNVRKLFGLLFAVIARNPIGLLVTALAGITAAMVGFQDQLRLTKEGTETVGDALETFGDFLDTELTQAINDLGFEFDDFEDIIDTVVRGAAQSFLFLLKVIAGTVAAFRVEFAKFKLTSLEDEIKRLTKRLEDPTGFDSFIQNLFGITREETVAKLAKLTGELEKVRKASDDLGKSGLDAFLKVFREFDARVANKRLFRELEEFANLPDEFGQPKLPDKPDKLGPGKTPESIGLDELRKSRKQSEDSLRSLEAAHFPLLAARDRELKTLTIIGEALENDIELRVDAEELIRRQTRTQLGLGISTKQLAEEVKLLNELRQEGVINLKEEASLIRDATIAVLEAQKDMASGFERGFLKMGKAAKDFASLTETSITNAFQGAEDALVKFVTTGKFEFSSLVNSILSDLARLAIQKTITDPLFTILSAVGTSLRAGSGTTGGGSEIATGLFATGATGGLLRGSGSGTMDNIPVRLSNGEFVTNAENTTRFLPLLQAINGFSGGGGGSGGGVVVQVIDKRGSQAAPVSRQERTNADGTRIISLIIRDTVRRQVSSGELDQPFQARFGLNPALRTR